MLFQQDAWGGVVLAAALLACDVQRDGLIAANEALPACRPIEKLRSPTLRCVGRSDEVRTLCTISAGLALPRHQPSSGERQERQANQIDAATSTPSRRIVRGPRV